MSLDVNDPRSVRDRWARHHVNQALRKSYNKYAHLAPRPGLDRPLEDHEDLPEPPELDLPLPPTNEGPAKVCIIGAGAAGLFTALLFDYLNATVPELQTNPIQYDIFESADETRGVGGRLYTYNFSDTSHDYYDVGAMRFPQNPVMDRTFALFNYLGMEMNTTPSKDIPNGSIIPYYMQGNNEPWYFNNKAEAGPYSSFAYPAANHDPFLMSFDTKQPIDPRALAAAAGTDATAKTSPGAVLGFAIEPLVEPLKTDYTTGWNNLMDFDSMSTTYFLSKRLPKGLTPPSPTPPVMPPFDYNTIEWLETFGGGTNWYDQANSETVLEYLDFDYDAEQYPNWWCIEGGAQQLAIRMRDKLKDASVIQYSKRITGINASTPNAAQVQIDRRWQGTYTGVFNSTALGCMQQMDLSQAGLNYGQKQAIRSLGYGASAKVGMKFSEPWWITKFGINQGGLGHSDLPMRTTVYPSYNLYDDPGSPAVLLCSYEWQQDAQRISTYISSNTDHTIAIKEEASLKELILRDLALLHSGYPAPNNMTPEEVYDMIKPLYVDHYAHDWYHDINTFGAFAFFRPQQFGAMWPYIIQPTPSVAMIGEHASTHHAWVVGALESAVNGVYGWLIQNTNSFYGAEGAANVIFNLPKPNPADPSSLPFGGLMTSVSMAQRKWQRIFGLIHEEQFHKDLKKHKHG